MDQVAPDQNILNRFLTAMTKAEAFEPLFKEINAQLETHHVIIKKGVLVDASVVDTPLKSKGKTYFDVTKDREDKN